MGKAPCCDKMGLKKGQWTPEEDRILISHIRLHGHSNWRALPKQAGLSRCGKSCRLRWVNYLNPDIKRGNFTPEEEEAVIKLHEMLGNKWSAIAARLPGRTDNEIKNVWHTYLKKRVNNNQTNPENQKKKRKKKKKNQMMETQPTMDEQNKNIMIENPARETGNLPDGSPQQSTKTTTTATTTTTELSSLTEASSEQFFPEIDESFWSENLMNFEMLSTVDIVGHSKGFGFEENVGGGDGGMDFWYNVFLRTAGQPELPEF